MSRTVVIETRFQFGQFHDGASTSSSTSTANSHGDAIAAPLPDLSMRADEHGDRLSPIARHRGDRSKSPNGGLKTEERAPSHHRGLSGPTTPRSKPSTATPPHAAPSAPARPIRPAATPSAKEAPRPIGPHDFATGLPARQIMPGANPARVRLSPASTAHVPSVGLPPHARRDGRGINRLMNRGALLAPPTGTPAQWENAAAKRREGFAHQFNRGVATDSRGNDIAQRQPFAPAPRRGPIKTSEHFTRENAVALRAGAAELGVSPRDLALAMAHETRGTFSPSIWGGKGGRYMGLIQFGPRERRDYGAHDRQSFREQMPAVVRYLKSRGVRPGMGLADLYSTILAGRPGLYNRRDQNGSVMQHVMRMQRDRAALAERFLASGSVGATPSTVAGGSTPQGPAGQTSTAKK